MKYFLYGCLHNNTIPVKFLTTNMRVEIYCLIINLCIVLYVNRIKYVGTKILIIHLIYLCISTTGTQYIFFNK